MYRQNIFDCIILGLGRFLRMNREVSQECMYPQIDMKLTGVNLKFLCMLYRKKVKDITQYLQVASVQSVYDWFYGKTLPTIDHLMALSILFELPMEDLLVLKKMDCSYKGTDISNERKRRMLFYIADKFFCRRNHSS